MMESNLVIDLSNSRIHKAGKMVRKCSEKTTSPKKQKGQETRTKRTQNVQYSIGVAVTYVYCIFIIPE